MIDIIRTLPALNLRDITTGDIIMHLFQKERFILITTNKVTDSSRSHFAVKTIDKLFCTKSNFKIDDNEYTYAKKRYYPDHEFYRLSKDITPEYFL